MRATLTGVQRCLLLLVAVSIPLSAWEASYPPNTWLQLGPVAVLVCAAPFLLRRYSLSDGATVCVASFLLLHTLAARWTYSDVPYDAWSIALTGLSIDGALGLARNDFDRLVHFCFGLLAVRPVAEIARRQSGIRPPVALCIALEFVFAISALYEIFEWSLAVFMDPAAADAYNGQQGDMFDAQKDMAKAALGGLVATVISAARQKVVGRVAQ
jgi:putative membrane protein